MPCVYLPGPAPAVTVANTYVYKLQMRFSTYHLVYCRVIFTHMYLTIWHQFFYAKLLILESY